MRLNTQQFLRRFSRIRFLRADDYTVAGWSSLVAREAHNLEVVGSNPAPATKTSRNSFREVFYCSNPAETCFQVTSRWSAVRLKASCKRVTLRGKSPELTLLAPEQRAKHMPRLFHRPPKYSLHKGTRPRHRTETAWRIGQQGLKCHVSHAARETTFRVTTDN